MRTQTTPLPARVTIGSRTYSIGADGWSPDLGCYFSRMPDGRLCTIPVDA